MRSTATAPRCGPSWRAVGSATCWWARDHRVRFGGTTCRADALLRHVPARAWQCVSAGKGAKGHRLYDWAFLRLDHDGSAPCAQAGPALVDDPPQSQHRRAGLLPLLYAPPRWPCWSGSPAGAGRSRRPSRLARALLVWTTIRSAAGARGDAELHLVGTGHAGGAEMTTRILGDQPVR